MKFIRMRNQGFTLIELIVTIAVAIILATVAVPSFRSIIIENQLATQTNNFLSSLALVRSEAIKRGVRVTLCKSTDGVNCATTGGYDQGWIIFPDAAPFGARPASNPDVTEPLIRYFEPMPDSVTATGNTNVTNFISYLATGEISQAGTITICRSDGHKREVIISSSGRARSVKDEANVCP